MDFRIVGRIDQVETIAEGNGIRELATLRQQFGLGRWKKRKGVATRTTTGRNNGAGGGTLVRGARHRQGQTQDQGMAMKHVVCVSREGFGDFSTLDLTLGRIYEVIESSRGTVRIVDDSGEDYLYPAQLFEPVEVENATAARLHDVLRP